METNYAVASPNGGDFDNQTKTFVYAGALSWCLFVITGWLSFFVPDCCYWIDGDRRRVFLFWLYPSFRYGDGLFYALYTFFIFFYLIAIISLIWSTAGLFIYIYSLFMKKEGNVINEMLGIFTRYHFVPFLCGSVLSIVSECSDTDKYDVPDISKFQTFLSIIVSFLGLCSLGFIFFLTKLEYPLYAKFGIRGTYSCLLTLFSFSFFYNIYYFGYLDNKDSKLKDWIKGTNITFAIIFGAVNLTLSALFKDIILAGINTLFYIGMTINYFLYDDDDYNIFDGEKIVGVIDIIIALGSIGLASFLFIKYNPFVQTLQ